IDDLVDTTEPIQHRLSLTGNTPKPQLSLTAQHYHDPNASDASGDPNAITKAEMIEAGGGLVYLVFTLVLSCVYLTLLAPAMSNDLWWGGFNASGAQSFVIDAYNAQLNLNASSLDLTKTNLFKDYSQFYTPISVTPVYPRIILDAYSYDLPSIIRSLQTGPEQIPTQYCWVDFTRIWEVAHTDQRQKRCSARYTNNGAVYWESMMRLIDWNSYVTLQFGGPFNTTIGNALRKTPEGLRWIAATQNAFVNVDSEVAYWQKSGITRYTMQFTNSFSWGMRETVSLQNAFGSIQNISLKRSSYISRTGQWTTNMMYWGTVNDYSSANTAGYSFVRSDSKHQRFTAPCNYSNYLADPASYACVPCDPAWNPNPSTCKSDFEKMLGLPNNTGVQLIRSNIGPLNSIDMYFVRPPASLTTLYSTFRSTLDQLVHSDDSIAAALNAIPTLPSDPVPSSWQKPFLQFMGGDPTCLFRPPMPFVQSSFAFDVSCSTQQRHEFKMDPFNSLFALWATSATTSTNSSSCSLCPTLQSSCNAVFSAASQVAAIMNRANSNSALIQAAYADIKALGVSTIQLAVNTSDSTTRFLRQPVLGGDTTWDTFGWMYVHEWAQGYREVVSFEGDAGIIPLISDKYSPMIIQAQALEVSKNACQYLWVVSVVVSYILVAVGILVLVYSFYLRARVVGRNFFQFNRIVGAVWLGRALLIVRGMTALILLSTSPINFQTWYGFANFEFDPRSFIQSMLLAGEAMWISYVFHDCVVLCIRQSRPYFAPISTCLSWLIYVIIDVASPINISSSLNRQCAITLNAMPSIVCTSGQVSIGNISRATTLIAVQIVSTIVLLIGNSLWQYFRPPSHNRVTRGHLLLSGTAAAFLAQETLSDGSWIIDRASCIMCGLLTYGDKVFDLKLWLVVAGNAATNVRGAIKWNMKVFEPPNLNLDMNDNASSKTISSSVNSKAVKPTNRLVTLGGFIYICATIFGSVTYVNITASNMANDFWWPNYNASREHICLARIYIAQMYVRPKEGAVSMDNPAFIDTANFTISLPTPVTVNMKALYAANVAATDGIDMSMVIAGFRNMDACITPWISTMYCWLDFTKKWEMANSAARQARCAKKYTSNGAVYLEPILRNVQWPRLRTCWGTSLDTAIANPLSQLPGGAAWWAAVQASKVSEVDELQYWQSFGVKTYEADWQNYKSIGIVDTIDIQNAFGIVYSLTNKYTNWTLNLAAQTSMKMNWQFASDLWAISSPNTSIYGASLIRQAPLFAYANRTIESILVENGTMRSSDLTTVGAYSVFRRTIGPFGSVDLKHVPVPPSLTKFTVAARDAVYAWRVLSVDFANQYSGIPGVPNIGYYPPPWQSSGIKQTVGGNLLCNDVPPAPLASGPLLFTSITAACGSNVKETVSLSIMSRLYAVLGANLVRNNVTANETAAICSTVTGATAVQCANYMIGFPARAFLNDSILPDPSAVPALQAMAQIARDDVYKLGVEMVQYGKFTNGSMTLLRYNLFDPAYPQFHYAAWALMYDWATVYREVIDFQGDIDNVKIITATSTDVSSLVNPLEVPVNVAAYVRYVCVYVTTVIICVALLATIYLLVNKGYVEGLNLLELNRVAGLVWIGRTLLFVRSLAAICLLSTQSLVLITTNQVWLFASAAVANESSSDKVVRIFKTFIAAGEVSWLGFVLSDFVMVFTAQYTPAYVFKCNFMIWGLAALLSWVSPATHTATMYRQCSIPQVDFQVVCSSGTMLLMWNDLDHIVNRNCGDWKFLAIYEPCWHLHRLHCSLLSLRTSSASQTSPNSAKFIILVRIGQICL
ncbi:unnamed protein product, partial [Aphanomyces euteiches]